MRAITTVYGLAFTLVCGVFVQICWAAGAEEELPPVTVEKIYVEKKTKNDLESQATGYIFRSDGDSPPIYIKLGSGNIHQYDDMLKRAGERPLYYYYYCYSKIHYF
jgi:UDP:flavonoid glycosyltransferase YjiC (YdhE family)